MSLLLQSHTQNSQSPAAAKNSQAAIQHCPPVEFWKKNSSKATKIGTKFSAGHGLFNQFLMRTVLLNQLEGTLFYPQSLRHNICHINKDHLIPQALNILQASTSSPSGNTTLPTVSLFLLKKHHKSLIFYVFVWWKAHIFRQRSRQ